MQFAQVIGTLVATQKVEGLEGVKFLIVQPLDKHRQPVGPEAPGTWLCCPSGACLQQTVLRTRCTCSKISTATETLGIRGKR